MAFRGIQHPLLVIRIFSKNYESFTVGIPSNVKKESIVEMEHEVSSLEMLEAFLIVLEADEWILAQSKP